MATTTLNIHNLIQMRVATGTPALVRDFSCPLRYFADAESGEGVAIDVSISGDFEWDITDCQPVDHKYFVRDRHIAFREVIGGFRYRGQLRMTDDRVTIDFAHNWKNFIRWPRLLYADLTAFLCVVQPVIRIMLARQGYFLLHGVALTDGDRTVFISGRGGVHKTSIAIALLRRGWQFLGDDMIIAGPGGMLLSYPLFLGRFNWLAANRPDERTRRFDSVRLLSALLRRVPITVSVADRASASRVIYLHAQPGATTITPLDWERPAYIKGITLASQLEHLAGPHFKQILGRFLEAYVYAMPQSDILDEWLNLEQRLTDYWANIPVCGFTVPTEFDEDLWLGHLLGE